MNIGGIQKLTLLDYPEKTACTLFTVGCNFRCPFCQNSSLIDESSDMQKQSASEILSFLQTRQGKLDGVCISGGEPLINENLVAFIHEVKALGFLVKLDTNGSFPQKLEKLLTTGMIDYVAMDIKNSPEKYAETIGVPDYNIVPIEESIKLLCSGLISHEFRTTVVREYHTADDLVSIARWLSGAKKYYLQGFINSDGVVKKGLNGYSKEEMEKILQSVKAVLPTAELRGI